MICVYSLVFETLSDYWIGFLQLRIGILAFILDSVGIKMKLYLVVLGCSAAILFEFTEWVHDFVTQY